MNEKVPVEGVIPSEHMAGDDEEEKGLLYAMLGEAHAFLKSFSWFTSVRNSYFGCGIGGIVAVFLFDVETKDRRMDEWLWVITGDIPPAYLVIDNAKDPVEALDVYMKEISRWVILARKGMTSAEVIPVNVPATPEWAGKLAQRLQTLRETIRPELVARAMDQSRE